MAYDIPSISDLEATQLLNKHYAEVITSKEGGVSSAADITQTTNPITGVVRRTLYKILDDMDDTFLERLLKMAFTPVGTFTAGATLTDARQTLLWEVSQGGDGHYYSWSGSFPKVVSAGSSPSPIEAGSWVDRTDDSLRDEIRETVFQNMKRLAAEAGFNLVDGSFEEGAVISGWPDVVWSQTDGHYYSWYLDEAKTIAAGSTPTPLGAGGWIDRSDVTLRSEILDYTVYPHNIIHYTNGSFALTQSAITQCETYCNSVGTAMEMIGEFTATESLSWDCNTDAYRATIKTDFGIVYGGAVGVELRGRTATLPNVIPLSPNSTPNTYLPGAGVTIQNVTHGEIFIGEIGLENGGWETGLHVLGNHAGCAWNDIIYMYGKNNRVNFKASRIGALGDADGVGFANQNLVRLIRMYKKPHVVGGSPDATSYHIYLDSADSNTFLCPAIEQDTFTGRPGATTLAYIKNSADNQLLRAHTESPKGTLIVFDNASNNTVEPDGASSGYGIVVNEINGALYNRVDRGRWGEARLLHRPVCYGHGFDIDRPVVEVYDQAHSVHNRDGGTGYTDWTYRLFAARSLIKNATDTYPRLDLNGRGGYLSVGDGSIEPLKQYRTVCHSMAIFGNNTYIAPTSVNRLRLDSGTTHVTADFTMVSTDGTITAFGKFQAMVSYSGSGDYSIISQKCIVDSTLFDSGTVDVKLNTYTDASNILQFRAKAKYTTNQNILVNVSIFATMAIAV